jgi:hypothetical protein
LDQFLSEHRVETHAPSVDLAQRFENHVFHRTVRPTQGGGRDPCPNGCRILRCDSLRSVDLWAGPHTTDVPDITVIKDFTPPVYVTVYSAVSSDHQPVLYDTNCRNSFQIHLAAPTSHERTGSLSRLALKRALGKYRGKRRGGNQRMRLRADQRYPRGPSRVCSQESTAWQSAACIMR